MLPRKNFFHPKKLRAMVSRHCIYSVAGGRQHSGAHRVKIGEKVHKPPLGINIINLELNGFDASIWVLQTPSESKKL